MSDSIAKSEMLNMQTLKSKVQPKCFLIRGNNKMDVAVTVYAGVCVCNDFSDGAGYCQLQKDLSLMTP